MLAQSSQESLLDIPGAVRIWVVVGSIGFLLNILPIRFGIWKSVFMLLLSPFLPLTAALVTVFLMGVFVLIADALWGEHCGRSQRWPDWGKHSRPNSCRLWPIDIDEAQICDLTLVDHDRQLVLPNLHPE